MTDFNIISPEKLGAVSEKDGVILDVRTPAEHAESHLAQPHAHVPLGELDPADFMLRRGLDRETAVYMLCKAGTRARAAAEKFIAAGYKNVHVIEGGIIACGQCGVELASALKSATANLEKKAEAPATLSLERQVRLAAGVIITLGMLLGLTVSAVWLYLPLALGAGLVMSGLTGKCLLAFMLKRMPWNRALQGQADNGAACAIIKPDNVPASSSGPGKPGCA